MLGQNGRMLEYRPEVNPTHRSIRKPDGLHIHAMFTQRLQDNSRWPNPIVLKITGVKPALTPPSIETLDGSFDRSTHTAVLTGRLLDMGKTPELEVGFDFRSIVGLDASDRSIAWQSGPSTRLKSPGAFTLRVPGLNPDGIYEYRAWVKHPLLTINGAEKRLPAK